MSSQTPPDRNKFINPAQIGGIERYTIDDGAARGSRALCVNTGGGLRYRILVDRGLDIDQAFFNQHSIAFLTHKGASAPTRAFDQGLDWLKGFPGGLLTSCGPGNVGPPGKDAGEQLGLHGTHSHSPASLESVHQPDLASKSRSMSVTGTIRYGALYGPCLELRRTIGSMLGENHIDLIDEFTNVGNQSAPHAWLLHINLGYPLVNEGAELCYRATEVRPLDTAGSRERFSRKDQKIIPAPMESHRGSESAVAYLFPKPADSSGRATVGIVNSSLSLGVAIHYNTRQFPRCGNWQHFAPGEFVTALEPMNGTIEGRASDRAAGLLDTIQPGERRRYRYGISVLTDAKDLAALRELNR